MVACCFVCAWLAGCSDGTAAQPSPAVDPCAGNPEQLATCLAPTRPPAEYVAQALLYFDTLDGRADPSLVPSYSAHVVRWEWPPWLKLTLTKQATARPRTATRHQAEISR